MKINHDSNKRQSYDNKTTVSDVWGEFFKNMGAMIWVFAYPAIVFIAVLYGFYFIALMID